MLSREEREGLLIEAADARRRDALRRARASRLPLEPDRWLQVLSEATRRFPAARRTTRPFGPAFLL